MNNGEINQNQEMNAVYYNPPAPNPLYRDNANMAEVAFEEVQKPNYQQQNSLNNNNLPIHNVVLPQGQPYFPHENFQGNYAIHQSQMVALNNQGKMIGQPQPQNFNMGYNYPNYNEEKKN